ncbi:MarR family winged helix-turn-helix transcriptional regulator [Actinokineospora fastidiosa]|uniref:Transcriptional regulator n=1 Tax=Actinokineospora fastidiosa TaxID=1816 RepID=A0A918GT10_9PSEU|nr:MarR family transcriptional regulator [Actinokineospora fastidiosa]GGS58484.1 transcriptional regulator [Actinokineospora fastidiosa]
MADGQRFDDEVLITLLRRLTVESDRFAEMFAEVHGVHRTDMNALAVIMDAAKAGTPLSPTALAAALNLSNSATTSLLDRLERAGHVERIRSARDRRKIELRMRDQARELGIAFFAPLRQELLAAWRDLPDDHRAVIGRFLTTTIDATVTARGRFVEP